MRLYLIILFCFLGFSRLCGQGLEIGLGVQKNVMDIQYTYDLTFRYKNFLGLGVFGQSSQYISFEEKENNYPIIGLDISLPLKTCEELRILAHLKGGLVNNQFFIITPELETRLKLIKHIYLSTSIGIRRNQEAIGGKLPTTIW